MDEKKQNKYVNPTTSITMILGIAFGASLGVIFDNIAIGIGVGIALGAGMSGIAVARADD